MLQQPVIPRLPSEPQNRFSHHGMLAAILSSAASSLRSSCAVSPRARALPNMCAASTWEPICGSYVLRPPPGQQPCAMVHFLGGALVGASPHLTYPRLMSHLATAGFVVIATPYELDFDYLRICDRVRSHPALA